MKTIRFDCTHCEARRPITILDVQQFYIVGECTVCKSKITINKKRFDVALAAKK